MANLDMASGEGRSGIFGSLFVLEDNVIILANFNS